MLVLNNTGIVDIIDKYNGIAPVRDDNDARATCSVIFADRVSVFPST